MAAANKPPEGNRALRMLGLPALPKKLPSRNWMIFWTVSTALSAAIIYDRREKRRATARWAHAVEHLAREPLTNASAMPRRLTVYLEAPPGDGIGVAQSHFVEYVKPILAASGLDWDFVQGRRQGDVRAVVAERVRRARRSTDAGLGGGDGKAEPEEPTEEDMVEAIRRKNGIQPYEGTKGDIVVGRHTWKEYIRGLHEGWLGPLSPPPEPPKPEIEKPKATEGGEGEETKAAASEEEEKKEKPKRPPQPRPYNKTDDYPASPLPMLIPAELGPATPIRFPHILGFLNTPTRMRRFFGRRYLADKIGREVAAACLCTHREFLEDEQRRALEFEERDWVKSVWKEDDDAKGDGDNADAKNAVPAEKPERIWTSSLVLDPRISERMRKFELRPDDEQRVRGIIVKEEEIEGSIKRHLRQLWRWGARKVKGDSNKKPNIGPLDE